MTKLTLVTIATVLLAALSAGAVPVDSPAAAPTGGAKVAEFTNTFSGNLNDAVLANPVCAAAAKSVDANPTIRKCFPEVALFFSTPSQVCRGVVAPGAPEQPECFNATVAAAKQLADACTQDLDGGFGQTVVYKSWGNAAAAADACSVPGNGESKQTALEQTYFSHMDWATWQWTGVPEDAAERKRVLCTDANKVYWRNVAVLGEQPIVYYSVMTNTTGFTQAIADECKFAVPKPAPARTATATATATAGATPTFANAAANPDIVPDLVSLFF
ncbi:hypothetical protein H9P43_001554 [Blastocladiella emersonii ATCC 22665]|nr:hypothetical protein H9P43_001554 [Blastocladiella emersonii ATCC 22665]